MIKVDTIYGNDIDENDNNTLRTLTKAMEISKTGDSISLMPGNYDSFSIKSITTNFELKIIGSGANTVCPQSTFEGFFDFTYENLKIDNCDIKSNSSNFIFRDVKFASMNTIQLSGYNESKNNNSKTYIVFEKCRFNHNFQIIILSGSYVISFKSCEIAGKIPLIFAKKGEVTIRMSNTDFESPILLNKESICEIQYTCCNFTCPIYQGKEVLVISKDNIYNATPTIPGRPQSLSILGSGSSDEMSDSEFKDKSGSINKDREFYGGIVCNSDDFGEIPAHKYTKVIYNKGTNPLFVKLPKIVDNGHILKIISKSPILIDIPIEDHDNKSVGVLDLVWIYPNGWLKIPSK